MDMINSLISTLATDAVGRRPNRSIAAKRGALQACRNDFFRCGNAVAGTAPLGATRNSDLEVSPVRRSR